MVWVLVDLPSSCKTVGKSEIIPNGSISPCKKDLDMNKAHGASTPEEQNITIRFQQNPGECHWTAVKNILKYLRNTKDMFLVYGGNPEAEPRVMWTGRSSQESTTALSVTEAKIHSSSEACNGSCLIRKFISGLE
ncbi:hypothetical protein Tco_0541439 [Tanacetum coccineum]